MIQTAVADRLLELHVDFQAALETGGVMALSTVRNYPSDQGVCRVNSDKDDIAMAAPAAKDAKLYRMVTPEHTCPWGLKALDLLKWEGFKVQGRHLKSREETDAFKAKHQVKTTPQAFIDGKRVGGYDDLREYLGKEVKNKDAVTYTPVIALFSMAMALAASWARLWAYRHNGSRRVVRRLRDVSACAPETEGRGGLRHNVPELRSPRPTMDSLCHHLPLR